MPSVLQQLVGLPVTDTLKHASQPSTLTKLPFVNADGTWTEATGWSPASFEAGRTGGNHSGLYLNTGTFSGDFVVGIKKTTGGLSSPRQFEVWFIEPSGTELNGYQLLVLAEKANTAQYILRRWIKGAEKVLWESAKGQAFLENDSFYLARVGHALQVYHRVGVELPVLLGEAEDTTFPQGYCGFGGNGSNPKLIDFVAGQLRAEVPDRTELPLALDVEIEGPTGTFTLTHDSPDPSRRPRGISFTTQRGDGFATAGLTLSRKIFRDYPDLNLLDTWRFISQDGKVVYEGRLSADPRSNEGGEQIEIALIGFMTYLKSRKIAPLIIDRRLSGWGEPSIQRRAEVTVAGYIFNVETSTGIQDTGEKGPGLVFRMTRGVPTYKEIGELWFYAGGEDIGEVGYDFDELQGFGEDTDFIDNMALSEDDKGAGWVAGTDHNQKDATNQKVSASGATGKKYAAVQCIYTGTAEGDLRNLRAWENIRVVGTHGLEAHGTHPEEGYYLTDVLQYILTTFYPKLEWAGEENTFPLTQATWHDNPTYGYDILQQLNGLVLWESNVWTGPKLYFESADLSTNDWEIRTDDPGVTVVLQGAAVEDFASGVQVTYVDFSGVKRTLTPTDHEELRDENENNPANRQGENLWTDVEVPWACLEAEALQFGRAYLAEYNRPKRPGQFRIAGGYIKDSAGHERPGYEVRCSQTIGITDDLFDAPRLIFATAWDDQTKELVVTVDAPDKELEAIVARHELASTGRNQT